MLSRVFLVSMKVRNNLWFLLLSCFLSCKTTKHAVQSRVELRQVNKSDSSQLLTTTSAHKHIEQDQELKSVEDRQVVEYVFSEPVSIEQVKAGTAKVKQVRVVDSKKQVEKKHTKTLKQDRQDRQEATKVSTHSQRDSLGYQARQDLRRSPSSAFWLWVIVAVVVAFGLFRFGRSFLFR